MPRYYLHIVEDVKIEDPEGVDLEAAREQAPEAARELVCEAVRKGFLNLDHRVEIADECGNVQAVLDFRDAFRVAPDRALSRSLRDDHAAAFAANRAMRVTRPEATPSTWLHNAQPAACAPPPNGDQRLRLQRGAPVARA